MRQMGILAFLVTLNAVSGDAWAVTPAGLVYESEAISAPQDAWLLDQRVPDRWLLWTKEQDIALKRSGGAVLASPPTETDRATPADGAPPLHSVVSDLASGAYRVYVSGPGRPLAYSRDGVAWEKHAGGEFSLGLYETSDGPFELWVDDRYACPKDNPGPGYYDYIRFIPVPASAKYVERYAPWPSLDRWLASVGGRAVPATQTTDWAGFQAEGDCIQGERAGNAFSYTFDRAGTFYLAALMTDDEDGIEELDAVLNGTSVGCIVADEPKGGRFVYSFTQSIDAKAGDVLTFTCGTPVGYYRVYTLYFAPEPIAPPPPAIENVEVWSPAPGAVDLCWTTTCAVETGVVEYGVAALDQATPPDAYVGRDHRITLRGLDPAVEYQARIRTSGAKGPVVFDGIRFTPAPPAAAPSPVQTIELTIPEPTSQPRSHWPATIGLPFAQGMLAQVADLRLFDAADHPVPLEATCFSRWRDGSVKWATLDFPADTAVDAPRRYALKVQPAWDAAPPEVSPTLAVEETTNAWRLTTGEIALDVVKQMPALCHHVGFDRNGDGVVAEDERILTEPLGANVRLEDGSGVVFTCGPPEPGSFAIETNGPTRAVVKWSGTMIAADGQTGWWYLVRLTLWKGQPTLGLNLTVGHCDATPEYRPLKTLVLRVPLDGNGGVCGAFDGQPLEPAPDADGLWLLERDEAHSTVHNAAGTTAGERSQGLAVAADDRTRVSVWTRDFWQKYPSGYSIKDDAIHVGLLPSLAPDAYSAQADPKWFYRLNAWFKDGQYLFRAGQVMQKEVFIRYAAPDDAEAPETFAAWCAQPLLPQAPPAYLCATGVLGRPLFARTHGIWDRYEEYFEDGYLNFEKDRDTRRSYGWMHYGDWYGERICNFGNSEYDTAWTMALQWMRTGDRRYFERGLQMAQHNMTVDTLHGAFCENARCLVWEHAFNHTGTALTIDELGLASDPDGQKYLDSFGGMLHGAMDPQGHVFQQGNWLYAALTGNAWYRETADRVCATQARVLTPAFNFGIERCGGWPLINADNAYNFSGNPYYLNEARIMIERCLERQDPATGGWLHTPPKDETDGVAVLGGKAFAVGILTHGILRYLEQEPNDRPDVRHMLVRGADWLMNESWIPGKGFRYITNAPNCRDTGSRGMTCLLVSETVAFAYEETGDTKYLDFWKEIMQGAFDAPSNGMGKGFTQATRQTVFALDRAHRLGIDDLP